MVTLYSAAEGENMSPYARKIESLIEICSIADQSLVYYAQATLSVTRTLAFGSEMHLMTIDE